MKIIPIAAESLGVRSSAVFVETRDLKILIDPGVSLASLRFGLPPHPFEVKRMNALWRSIKEYAGFADILIITHYHFDHFEPTCPLLYRDKTVLFKHPTEKINASQRQRANVFLKNLGSMPRVLEIADGKAFSFGNTELRFSRPVPHGPDMRLGWVVQVSIEDASGCFAYTSDVEGACREEHIDFLLERNPSLIYIDGPPTYILRQGFGAEELEGSKQNIMAVLRKTDAATLILDHHLIRDRHWKEEMEDVLKEAARLKRRVVTAAEFLGSVEEPLEAKRKELFERFPDMPEELIEKDEKSQLRLEL